MSHEIPDADERRDRNGRPAARHAVNEEQRDYAESISVSGEALLTIINDILDFSKIEAGRFELESLPFDLRDTVHHAAELIRPIAAKKGIELREVVVGDPPPRLMGDAGRVRQILLNLLSNAVKFTEHEPSR